jgi:hypothetical protein
VGQRCGVRNEQANKQRIEELYGDELPVIREAVRKANCALARDAVGS